MWTNEFLEHLKQPTIKEPRIEKAIAFKRQHLPKRIYKYRSDNAYARDNLSSSTIWLASPDSYNDPYDCFLRFSAPSMTSAFERTLVDPFIDGYQLEIPPDKINAAKQSATPLKTLSENINAVGKPGANPKQMAEFTSKVVPEFVERTVEMLQAMRSVLKMCSFSEVSDSILMWSLYGDNHQGFCIEYDLAKFDSSDAFLRNLYPVIYSHQLFDLTPWAEKLVAGKREDFTDIFPLLGVLQKFEGWAYEKEWRYVLFQEKPNPNRERPMPVASRVFLGAKALPSTTKELMEICEKKNVPVSQMRMSNDKYGLVADPISGSGDAQI